MKVGVVSDTHNNLKNCKAPAADRKAPAADCEEPAAGHELRIL